MRVRCPYSSLLILCALAQPALAASDCNVESDDCVAIGRWNFSIGLGLGSRSNPIVYGHDIPLVFVPQVSYYGKRFFIENLDVGVTLHEGAANTFNLVATPGYDRVFFYRNDLQNYFIGSASAPSVSTPPGPPPGPVPGAPAAQISDAELMLQRERHIAYLAGPEWEFDFGAATGQLDLLYEVTGLYSGAEVRAAVAVPLIQSVGALTATVGATWKSSAQVNYYYGDKDIYNAGSAFNPFAKLAYTLPFKEHWSVNAVAHFEWLDDAIVDSPIVVEQYVTTVFAGVTYSF